MAPFSKSCNAPPSGAPQNKLDTVGEAIDGEAQALNAKRVEALAQGLCVWLCVEHGVRGGAGDGF